MAALMVKQLLHVVKRSPAMVPVRGPGIPLAQVDRQVAHSLEVPHPSHFHQWAKRFGPLVCHLSSVEVVRVEGERIDREVEMGTSSRVSCMCAAG